MGRFIDLTGQRFGRLIVIQRANHTGSSAYWLCRCDCGNTIVIQGGSLRRGSTKSCGCLKKDVTTIHSGRKTRLYSIWDNMKSRCNNPNKDSYRNYGGRGIKVCPEWLHDFSAFRDWALSNGYDDDLTLDRIDNDKGYTPENCRWETRSNQNRNQRKNYMITYNGATKTLEEWASIYEIASGTLYSRIQRGWNIEKALNTPVKK